MKQHLTLENRVHLPLDSQPIRHGVPWPRGAVRPGSPLAAFVEDGAPIPLACRTLNCWPDGSVQWSLLDFAIDLGPSGRREITIETDPPAAAPPSPAHPARAREADGCVNIENGLVELAIVSRPGALVQSWKTGRRHVADENGFDVVIADSSGTLFSAAASSVKKVVVEEANPLRAVARVDGRHESPDGRTLLDFWLRFTVTANREDVRITYHYRNREKAEPGIVLRRMALVFRAALPASAERMIVHACRTRDFRTECYRLPEDFEIVSSNIPDLENYAEKHKGITGGGAGRVFLRQHELLRDDDSRKPWFLRHVSDFKFGGIFPPEWGVWSCLGLVSDAGSLLLLGANMAGLHPKSMAVEGNTARYSIWPEWAGPMDITQGEGRTLDFFVGPMRPGASNEELLLRYFSWEFANIYPHYGARPPVKVSMDVAHVRRCAVFAVERLPDYDPERHFAFERKVRMVWTPDDPIPSNGHWHYGDVYVNDAIGGNNEEMMGWMWFQEYLRSGRAECLERALAQTQHIADVDIVAYSNDPYQNGGMCAHGPRHNHCAAYPSHTWFTELLAAYALTGDVEFKKTAVRVCDNLVFWINDKTGFGHICADGRESGQPLINLAWTYQFAPEPRFLDAMWKIVRGSFMAKAQKHGRLTHLKPREDMALIRFDGYGDWAAWEGLFWVWELTRDEGLKSFILEQLEQRLTEGKMDVSGCFRSLDHNAAAYAYYLSGDRRWLERVARPFRLAFRAATWQFGWIKSMFYIKLAFEHGIVRDDDVLLP